MRQSLRKTISEWLSQTSARQKNHTGGKRKIIDTFINAIYLYDDHLKIIYNANGKEETVSLAELESSTLFSRGAPSAKKCEPLCGSYFFRWQAEPARTRLRHTVHCTLARIFLIVKSMHYCVLAEIISSVIVPCCVDKMLSTAKRDWTLRFFGD